MTGGSREHDQIFVNILTRLRTDIKGSGCRVFSSNMKVRIEVLDIFYYPDVSVTCDSQDREKYFNRRPCLIVEVLSPSTARIDRNEKLNNYRQLESVREYVLVSQTEIKVEIYRKDQLGTWNLQTLKAGDTMELESVGLAMPLTEIYEDVEF